MGEGLCGCVWTEYWIGIGARRWIGSGRAGGMNGTESLDCRESNSDCRGSDQIDLFSVGRSWLGSSAPLPSPGMGCESFFCCIVGGMGIYIDVSIDV